MANLKDLSAVLEAIDTAMSVVNKIAQAPGVNLLPYVNVLSTVISTVHTVYEAGKNVTPYIEAINNTFKSGAEPTEADVASLDAQIAALEAQIDAPLPPPEDGEED